MAAPKKDTKPAGGFEEVESALSRTEQFIEDNQKIITTAVIAIVVLVGAFLGYKRFIVAPAQTEAESEMFFAEQYFETDSFNLAINGDGNFFGFIDIIDEYSSTKAANLAKYYTGISYLHLGEYEMAIDYLRKFKSKDNMLAPIALGAIGDAYIELGDLDEGLTHYIRAAHFGVNEFLTPLYLMKAAQIHEEMGEFQKALNLYEEIGKDFPESTEGRNIEKYVTKARIKAGN